MFWVIMTIVVVAILLFKRHCDRRPDPSIKEIIKTISDFIEDKDGKWDWDDFATVPLKNPDLERIRKECYEIRFKYPSKDKHAYCSHEGIEALEELVSKLKQMPSPVLSPTDTCRDTDGFG